MKIFIIILVLLLAVLQYKLWFEKGGVVRNDHIRRMISSQQKVDKRLSAQNQKFIAQVYYLKHNKQSVEAVARNKFGMIKKGEIYYQIVDTKVGK